MNHWKQQAGLFVGLGLVLIVASVFRFYQIDQIPPGLLPDEATHALDALEVLEGQITIYSPDEGSTGALWRYLLALNFALFGPTIFSLRVFAAAVGVASVGIAYLLVRELDLVPAPMERNQVVSSWWREGIAILAALWLAVSYWHVDLSRVGFSAVLMLLVQDVTFFCLWRALASGHQRWFLFFGLGLGLLMYNYLPGKLVPAVVLLFFLGQWLLVRREALVLKWRRMWLLGGGVALLVALPLIIFGLFNYQLLWSRASVPTAGPVTSLSPWAGIVANLAAFGLWPAPWLSGHWETFFLGPLLTFCFIVGVGVSLIRIRRPVYLFLLIWWLVMLLPGALAPEGAVPHARRAIGAATVTFALVSLGWATLIFTLFRVGRWLKLDRISPPLPFLQRRQNIILPVVTLVLGLFGVAWTGTHTYHSYFVEWGPSQEAKLDFHIYDLELAEIMAAQSGPETVYLLPLDSTAGIINPLLDSITFVYRGQAAYDFLPDDEQTMPSLLAALTADKQLVRLVDWEVTKHTGADPKAVAPYYLEKWGRRMGADSYPYFEIITYELYDQDNDFAPAELTPSQIDFEGQMLLTGYAFGAEHLPGEALSDVKIKEELTASSPVPAGNRLWVELTWRKPGEAPVDYQVGLWLEDQAGHIVGRVDRPLLDNLGHRGTRAWPGGNEERDYYLLPVDSTAASGFYRLKTVLYTTEELTGENKTGGRRLAPSLADVGTDLAVTLGEVRVLPPLAPPDPADLPIPNRLDLGLGEGLRLLGFDPGFTGPLRPGDRATLRLWWQAAQPLSQDLAVVIGMGDEQQTWSLNKPQSVGGTEYPSHSWDSGTIVQTFIDLQIPAEVEAGRYNLGLRLLEAESENFLAEWLLGQVEVLGRVRNFEIPPLPHKVEANFGRQITLLGYDLDLSQVESSHSVRLVLYWQAQTSLDTAYKVFVHLLNDSGEIITQVDREPQAGEAPTTGWLKGEVITDVIDFPVDERLAGVSRIAVGLYNPQNGQRLPVVEASGEVQSNMVTIQDIGWQFN